MRINASEIALILGRELRGGDIEIRGCNTLEDASPQEISFLANPRYVKFLTSTRAGVVILEEKYASQVKRCIISDNPYLDFARVVRLFAKEEVDFKGISPLAYIHEEAEIGEDVIIYPFVYVGKGACIGKGTTLFSGVYVGEGCKIGTGCTLFPNVVLQAHSRVGNRVILHAGVVIGADGFGFAEDRGAREKFPQIGSVEIGDEVEIGANTTIDRAALGITRIGEGTKIDNQVQIGHNVEIGKNCVIVAQVGIAGSTRIGNNVILAGQVGITGHLTIGDGCIVGARAGVMKDLKEGGVYSGVPAMEHGKHMRVLSTYVKLPSLYREVRSLKKEVERLSKILKEKEGQENEG